MPICWICSREPQSTNVHDCAGWEFLERSDDGGSYSCRIVQDVSSHTMNLTINGKWIGICPDCRVGIRKESIPCDISPPEPEFMTVIINGCHSKEVATEFKSIIRERTQLSSTVIVVTRKMMNKVMVQFRDQQEG